MRRTSSICPCSKQVAIFLSFHKPVWLANSRRRAASNTTHLQKNRQGPNSSNSLSNFFEKKSRATKTLLCHTAREKVTIALLSNNKYSQDEAEYTVVHTETDRLLNSSVTVHTRIILNFDWNIEATQTKNMGQDIYSVI